MEAQEELEALVADYKEKLRLWDWDIRAAYHPDERWENNGAFAASSGSMVATLLVSCNPEPGLTTRDIVVHELVHAITTPLRTLRDQWLDKFEEATDKKLFERQMSDVEEVIVEHITRITLSERPARKKSRTAK